MSVILIISILIRLTAFGWSLAVMRRLSERRVLFLSAMLLLMAARQLLTLVSGLSVATPLTLDITARPEEFPGLLVSLMAFLVVLNLEGLVKRHDRIDISSHRLAPTPLLNALGIGFVAIVGSIVVSIFAFVNSRNAIREAAAVENLTLAETVCGLAFRDSQPTSGDAKVAAEEIRSAWSKMNVPYRGIYLCVIGPDGRLVLHTKKEEMIGADISRVVVSKKLNLTVSELLQSQKSWRGQNVNFRGISQLVGYHYEPTIDSLVAVHVPVKIVDAHFQSSVAPWIGGITLIGGLLMPLSLGVLFQSSRRVHAEALTTLEALQESEEKFRVLTERSPAGVVIAQDDRVVYCNSTLSKFTGYDADELLNMSIADIVHPDERKSVVDRHRRRLEGETVPTHYESMIVTKNGDDCWLDVSAELIEFQGRPAVLVTCINVTERKKTQQKLREQESHLAHVARLSTMGEMVAGIAHEINQPLAAIANYAAASKIMIEKSSFDSQSLADSMDRIKKQALSCGEIVKRLRGFLKKGDRDREWADLNQVVRDSLELFENEIRHRRICIDVSLPESETRVHIHPVELQQVIVNILRNACDATVEEVDPRISVCVACEDNEVHLTIEDNGPGVEESKRPQIFDAFVTTKTDSIGMGLAISRSIVESHEGNLRLDCGSKGATFHIDLPGAIDAASASN